MSTTKALINSKGYHDLSVMSSINPETLSTLKDLGYNVIALNQTLEETALECKKASKKKGIQKDKQDPFPEPVKVPVIDGLKILNRLTIEFSDSGIAHKMNQSTNLKKFDIVGVLPKTAQAFQYACASMDVDIITFDPSSKLPIKLNRKLYRQAVDRQVYFELPYSPAIRDSTCRKNVITTSHNYHAVGRSKNIVIASGADDHMYLRGVYDIINLGLILGLNEQQCKDALISNPRKLLLKAEIRRRGKTFVMLSTEDNVEEIDKVEDSLEPKTKKLKISE